MVVGVITFGLFQTNKNPPAENEPIKIGSISALTGIGVAVGVEESNGAQLAIEEINALGGIAGRLLVLIKEDVSIDKLKVAPAVAQKLVSVDKVVAIVGPQWDEPAFAILPVTEKAKVPMVGADNTNDLESKTNFDYFFSTWYDNRVGIEELLGYAQAKGYKKIAIMRPLGAGFWQFTANYFTSAAAKYGVEIVEDVDLGNPLLTDFRTPLTKIKTKNPDALFMVVSDYNQCTVLKQMREMGINIPLLSTEAAGNNIALRNCPRDMENIYFSTPRETEKYEAFAQRYAKRFGHRPEFPSAATAYDAGRVIAVALKETSGQGGEKLQKAILKVKISGTGLPKIVFDGQGFVETPENTFIMKAVRAGKYVPVD